MRIEEMRSGRAYLSRPVPAGDDTRLGADELRNTFPRSSTNERIDTGPVIPQSDLEKRQWSVVSFDGVEAGGLTYDQATRLIAVLGENGINGLCIITDVAALNLD